MFKVNNKNTRRRHWRRSSVFIVKFEYVSHFFFVFLMITLNLYLLPGRYLIKPLGYTVFTVNSSSNRIPVNFIKLLRWNIIKQMKESVAYLRSQQHLTGTLFDIN